jgi:hypothetical protein
VSRLKTDGEGERGWRWARGEEGSNRERKKRGEGEEKEGEGKKEGRSSQVHFLTIERHRPQEYLSACFLRCLGLGSLLSIRGDSSRAETHTQAHAHAGAGSIH